MSAIPPSSRAPDDPLRPFRGLLHGLALSVVFWVLVALLVMT